MNKMEEEYISDMKLNLKHILDYTRSNKVHINSLMKQPTLKDAHIYCKQHNMSGQFTGPALERYIKCKYNMTKNNASMCIGDLQCQNNVNFEIKASNGGKEHNKFNYVQLRMTHDCEYIFTAYYLNYDNLDLMGELFVFQLNKEQLKPLIIQYGGYAHGTIGEHGTITIESLNDPENKKEYALRPKYGDALWNELLFYRINPQDIQSN
jgi:hypothetical protein